VITNPSLNQDDKITEKRELGCSPNNVDVINLIYDNGLSQLAFHIEEV